MLGSAVPLQCDDSRPTLYQLQRQFLKAPSRMVPVHQCAQVHDSLVFGFWFAVALERIPMLPTALQAAYLVPSFVKCTSNKWYNVYLLDAGVTCGVAEWCG